MKKLLFIVLSLGWFTTYGQNTVVDTLVADTVVVDTGSVLIHKDPRLDMLIKKQAQINEITSRDARRTDKGYRIIIISTNNRDEAISAKTKVYTYFPELKAYLWYQSPYFRVKAGNFKDRKDAEAYQKRMNVYFPKGVFIMKDIIEVKLSKMDEDF
ncbi:MAG TPA: SPOR domain-containing protein [Chitinophagaceae bacterium]|nr:SPOR domain-containing protein [Chitinophagaceae bacterium]HRX93683.1 SPOR domain-containing protein [Chitinophagaceae bacterium]